MKVCFTGHRPDKLGGYDLSTPKNKDIISKLDNTILNLLNDNLGEEIYFICGGALGIDQIAFELCRRYRDNYSNKYDISLEVAVPFFHQDRLWHIDSKMVYRQQLLDANTVTYTDRIRKYNSQLLDEKEYHPIKMQNRNKYMVDNSDVVIAVWDGTKGGTGNCVKYAKSQGRTLVVITP